MFRATRPAESVEAVLRSITGDCGESEVEIHPGIKGLGFKLKERGAVRAKSPLSRDDAKGKDTPSTAPPKPRAKPASVTSMDWVHDVLFNNGGVVAAVPDSNGGGIVQLDQSLASGNGMYWINNMAMNSTLFNRNKTDTRLSGMVTSLESITLQTSVPRFMPEGDVYGKDVAFTDAYIDAGFKVVATECPYMNSCCVGGTTCKTRQQSCCAKEVVYTLNAAERGIAPCLLAAFYTQKASNTYSLLPTPSVLSGWEMYTRPNQLLQSNVEIPTQRIDSMVLVSQLSTFSLADIMSHLRHSDVQAKRTHLSTVLQKAARMAFLCIRDMCKVSTGFGLIKLNMTPESIVFCPKLVETKGGEWKLQGVGHMPVSPDYLDGEARLTDFHAVMTNRVREDSYSFETSYIMHCLLLVAFTRATQGPSVSKILWSQLLCDGDPTGFVTASKAVEAKSTNASSFLASMAANSDIHRHSDLYKALAEIVSDMDVLVRGRLIAADGSLAMKSSGLSLFGKMVSVVTRSSVVDTRVFSIEVDEAAELEEMEHDRGLQLVKRAREQRLL